MRQKIFIATSYYPKYLRYFYSEHPDTSGSYSQNYQKLMADRFSWSDYWERYMAKCGNFEVRQVVVNDEFLQKKWASEHRLKYSYQNWREEILKAQIQYFKPDIFFSHDTSYVSPQFRITVKQKLGVKTVLVWDGLGPQSIDEPRVSESDMILCCNRIAVEKYKKIGRTAFLFSFGFEPGILKQITSQPKYDISFVGGLSLRESGHNIRLKLLGELAKKTNISLFLSEIDDWQPWKYEQLNRLRNLKLDEFYDVFCLGSKNHGEKYGLDMFQTLSDSLITVNSHIDASGDFAGNIRLYEATGAGACLLTDWKSNLNQIFEIGTEVMAYKSANEAVEMIRWLLNNEHKRKQIAKRGQERTLKDYTFEKSVKIFIKEFNKYL